MILFNATSSRRKWYLVQMCLVFDDSAVVPEELRCCPRTSAQKKTGETLIHSTNQTDIRVLGWRMLVRHTPIRMTRVQPTVVSSRSRSLVLLHTCTRNLYGTRIVGIVCGLHRNIREDYNASITSHRDPAFP